MDIDEHAIWNCICLKNDDTEAIANSQHLAITAKRQLEQEQPRAAYWLRGLSPKDNLGIPEVPAQIG